MTLLPTHDVIHGLRLITVVISDAVKPIDSKRSLNNKPNCCNTGKVNNCNEINQLTSIKITYNNYTVHVIKNQHKS